MKPRKIYQHFKIDDSPYGPAISYLAGMIISKKGKKIQRKKLYNLIYGSFQNRSPTLAQKTYISKSLTAKIRTNFSPKAVDRHFFLDVDWKVPVQQLQIPSVVPRNNPLDQPTGNRASLDPNSQQMFEESEKGENEQDFSLIQFDIKVEAQQFSEEKQGIKKEDEEYKKIVRYVKRLSRIDRYFFEVTQREEKDGTFSKGGNYLRHLLPNMNSTLFPFFSSAQTKIEHVSQNEGDNIQYLQRKIEGLTQERDQMRQQLEETQTQNNGKDFIKLEKKTVSIGQLKKQMVQFKILALQILNKLVTYAGMDPFNDFDRFDQKLREDKSQVLEKLSARFQLTQHNQTDMMRFFRVLRSFRNISEHYPRIFTPAKLFTLSENFQSFLEILGGQKDELNFSYVWRDFRTVLRKKQAFYYSLSWEKAIPIK